MINPEMKQKWIEALRSGVYQQGRGKLRWENNSYCCLGVLCDIVDPSGWSSEAEDQRYTHHDREGFPPYEVTDKVGLLCHEIHNLALMNDDGVSFEEIANHIEELL